MYSKFKNKTDFISSWATSTENNLERFNYGKFLSDTKVERIVH